MSAEDAPAGGTGVGPTLRRRFRHAILAAAAVATIDVLRVWAQLSGGLGVLGWMALDIVVFNAIGGLLVVSAITAAQAALGEGWRRVVAMVLTGIAAVLALLGLLAAIIALGGNFVVQTHVVASSTSFLMATGWQWSAVAVALALFYATQAHEIALAGRARQLDLERAERERAVIESRLSVLRARVEPAFLFGALDDVRDLYRHDVGAADALVDALIAYLRTALPQMRGGRATLRREADLVRAYVAVLKIPRGEGLAVDDEVDPSLDELVVPPLLLLPFAQSAFAGRDASRRRRFAIGTRRDDAGVDVVVTVEGGDLPDGWTGEGPADARRSLAAVFGGRATLSFESDGQGHRATIRFPG